MNKTFKGGNVLWLFGFIISLLCVAGLLFLMFQERAKRIEADQALAEAKEAKGALELKLDQAQLELIQLKDKAMVLAKEVAEEKRRHQQTLEELEQKDAQLVVLENDLQSERKEVLNLDQVLTQLKQDYSRLEEKLNTAETKMEGLKGQLVKSKGKKGVQLKKIVVKPKKESLSGRVLVVNREFQFLVIDLGSKDGLSVGDEFVIYQGSEEVGRVQVERVYDTMSTATILPGTQEYKIMEDSTVKSF